MKIALAFPGFHRKGGVERIMFECAKFLAARGHDLTILANEFESGIAFPGDASGSSPEKPGTITYHFVPMQKRPSFRQPNSFFKSCTAELSKLSVDVLNTHGCVCPTGGVHWVQSVHRAWLEKSRQLRAPFSLGRLKQRINPLHPILLKLEEEHFRKRQFQRLIATTPAVASDLHRLYDVPLDSIDIVPNGFSPTEFNPTRRASLRAEMRAKLGLMPDHIALLLVANELDRKGYPTILSAMKILNNKNVRLIVCGRPDPARVKSLAANAGLAEQVIAFGSSKDVAQLHAAADLFVLPTQYEAFCLAILESLGSGLPVITSRVPGAQDAILPNINGQLVTDPKSGEELAAILQPLLNPTRIAALTATTPATAQHYQWPVVLEKYESILQNASGVHALACAK